MKSQWRVGELAKLTGLTVRTLRFYDQIGLLAPSGQTEVGHRLYNELDLSRLHQILSLKELGLTLEEIKSALDGGRISPLEIVELQIEQINEQMKLQQKLLDQLRYVSKLMQGKAGLSVEDFTNLLQAMKVRFEKPVLERQTSWGRHLDKLRDFLAEENGISKHEEENK
ncbi:MerR family transcriptional regulator [uncultured Paenibacillus sp.]|uniref:MerR family transcriptional regulator n=1 Tax=uncultured Paenibacillus sp. TaxID=227322 RepID=UPI0015B2F743|nr:MerR family transcriptional regulator [uncultured Paenibacillus sp.]